MLIAATYGENGEIFQHFGRTPMFKVYQVENGEIVAEGFLDPEGQGHGALAGILMSCGIEALLCGGIGPGAVNFLGQAASRSTRATPAALTRSRLLSQRAPSCRTPMPTATITTMSTARDAAITARMGITAATSSWNTT